MTRPACIGLLVFLALAGLVTASFATPITTKELETERTALATRQYSLRPGVNLSAAVYVHTSDGDAFFIHGISPLFDLRVPETVGFETLPADRPRLLSRPTVIGSASEEFRSFRYQASSLTSLL